MNSLASTPSSAHKPSILVIEDNPDQWFLIRWALLQRYAKVQINWLTKADEVVPYLDSCQQQQMGLPQMILLDLYLPSAQEGLTVLQTLKSHSIYKPVPTLVLSRSDSNEDINQVFNCSADGYLVKSTEYKDWEAGLSLLDKYLKQ